MGAVFVSSLGSSSNHILGNISEREAGEIGWGASNCMIGMPDKLSVLGQLLPTREGDANMYQLSVYTLATREQLKRVKIPIDT